MTTNPTATARALGPDSLPAGGHRAWNSRRRATLRVLAGRIWVTASDCLDDHFVDAEASLELPARARVLIGAESAAHFEIVVAPRERGLLGTWRSVLALATRARPATPAPRQCPATA